MKKSIIMVLSIAAMVAACGQGTGTGAQGGTTLGVAAGDQETLQRIKSLQVSKNTNVNVSFPAPGVLIGALNDEFNEIEKTIFFQNEGSCLMLCKKRLIDKLFGTNYWKQPSEEAERAADDLMKDAIDAGDYLGNGPTSIAKSNHPFFKKLIANAKAGNLEKIKEEYERHKYAGEIIGINKPNNGWPVRILNLDRNEEEAKEAKAFIKSTQESIEFANLVLTELASQVSAAAWRDPSAVKEAAQIAWRNMPIQKLRDAWAASEALPYNGASIDMTGHKGMHWTSEHGDYVGDGAGWTVIRHGAPWYGGGYLSGRQVTISLASSISSTQSKQSGSTASTGNNSSMDSGSNSQVK